MKVDNLIIGSGAGGLGTAVWMKYTGQNFMVVDSLESIPLNLHNGVHYLHSIPNLPFETKIREIPLTDGYLDDRGEIVHTPDLNVALQYSEKVREIQHPSSIMDIGKRNKVYMPVSNTLNTLLSEMYEYSGEESFRFGLWLSEVDVDSRIATFKDKKENLHKIEYKNLISTIPLDVLRNIMNEESPATAMTFGSNPVYITNYKVDRIVPNWMINLYIPSEHVPFYRASLLNGICSVESIRELTDEQVRLRIPRYLRMFYLNPTDPQRYEWKTGKVLSISMDDRETIVDWLNERDIYSLGRFGLWNRKLLVDSTISQGQQIAQYLLNGDWEVCRKSLI